MKMAKNVARISKNQPGPCVAIIKIARVLSMMKALMPFSYEHSQIVHNVNVVVSVNLD